jgi:type I restriction enzyme, S subunit
MAMPQHRESNGAFGDIEGLPEGWVGARLADIASIKMGQSPPGTTYNQSGEGLPFFQGKADFGEEHPRIRVWCSVPIRIADPGDVLISIRAPVGPTNIADRRCSIGRGLAAIASNDGIPNRFINYALRFSASVLQERATGSTFTAIGQDVLKNLVLPLPPLAEQKRIVGKIDALLARADAARDRLAKLPAILTRFRQSVLATACSGRLTADWRESHISKSSAEEVLRAILLTRGDARDNGGMHRSEPLEADCSQVSDVPGEWAVTSLDQLSCLITSGSRGWAKYYSDSGPLFIRAQDINTDLLRFDGIAHVKPPQNSEGSRTRVQVADLLVTVTGANVTKTALVDLDLGEAYVSQHVALVRLVDALVAPFVHLWIVSPSHGRKKLLGDAYGAGKPGLNLDNLRELVLALPPLAEQQEIVRRVETLFKLADGIENRVAMATARAEKLRQSILAKAFRGELVPTEAELARREGREYESASALLTRISSEIASKSVSKEDRKGHAPAALLS